MSMFGAFIGGLAAAISAAAGDDDMGFVAVPVTSDWNTASNAWTDIQAATGLAGKITGGGGTSRLDVTLWEGTGDSDDYAMLSVTEADPTFNFHFASAPVSGTAYVVGVSYEFDIILE